VSEEVTPPVPPAPGAPDPPVPQPRRDGVVLTQPPASPPGDPGPPRAPKQPFGRPAPSRPTDPQAGVDTREIPLAELQEAARRARDGMGSPAADPDVDLVEAEAQESALEVGSGLARAEGDERLDDGSAPASIDPRIRDRRVAVTRAEGRRRLRILLAGVSIASAIGIAWLVVQSPLLAVDSVTVKGTARESRAAVESAAAVKKGSALLFVDTSAVARRVEALPWVARATVDRDLPNGLTITVIERSPVAWARRAPPVGSPEGTLGAIVLVDRFGRVLGGAPSAPTGLPELVGMVLVPDRGERIEPAGPARAVGQLPDALRAQTGSVIRRHGQAVLRLVQPPGGAPPVAGEVRLGNLDEVAAKGAAALAVLDQLAVAGEHVEYVDVRVPGAPATR
jgi:cell division protein FtsQ